LGWAALSICGVVFVVGVLRGNPALEMFLIAVSLAIAAVPEGLPAVVTINLALGMREMIQNNALVRRLPAVETLGSASAICSDKTGTLTQNEMMVTRLSFGETELQLSGEGYRPWGFFHHDGHAVEIDRYPQARLLLQAAMLCNDAQLEVSSDADGEVEYRMVGDPTEGALVVAAAKAGLWREEQEQLWPRVAEIPFDSARKRMTTVHRVNGTPFGENGAAIGSPYIAIVKGAPEVILEKTTHILQNGHIEPLTPKKRDMVLAQNKALAGQALRVLGVAFHPLDEAPEQPTAEQLERDLVFVGLAGMIDPARPEVAAAIEVARAAGIRTVMVTGD
jgi:Ca2+-transporting ATPase